MVKKILATTDGSPASNRAVDLAAHMAIKHHASLYLLNVIRDMQLPAELRKMAKVERIGSAASRACSWAACPVKLPTLAT